jgi:hypothetical protein
MKLSDDEIVHRNREFIDVWGHEWLDSKETHAAALKQTQPLRPLFQMKGFFMIDDKEAKIQRWQRYIEECRKEAKLLSPDGQREMQTVIASYERLIAREREF